MRPDRGRWWRLLCTIIILFLVLHPYLLHLCVLHPRRCSYCVQGLHCKNLTQAHRWDGGTLTVTDTRCEKQESAVNVWPSPKSLPAPSVRAASLREKQEAAILWNKFPLMWTCWWDSREEGGLFCVIAHTHIHLQIQLAACVSDYVTVCCFWGEFLTNHSTTWCASQTPAVCAACLMHLAKKSDVLLPLFCALLCPWGLRTLAHVCQHINAYSLFIYLCWIQLQGFKE